MRLNGKIALVTGAARGIGEAIARACIQEGAVVYVTDVDDDIGENLVKLLGNSAVYSHLDVRDERAWAGLVNAILNKHGHLDIVVNNAGITGFESGWVAHDPEHSSLENWRAVHAVNLDGVFLGCKYAIQAMRKAGTGSIINISSRSGLVGIPTAAAYASSKAAVRNHTKSVALYCAQQGLQVRCNSIHPAAIMTPMWELVLGEGSERERNVAKILHDSPLKRFGTAEEVAAVAVMLASDEATYITGTEINIDGGLLAGSAATPD